jgi:hypothetical protein
MQYFGSRGSGGGGGSVDAASSDASTVAGKVGDNSMYFSTDNIPSDFDDSDGEEGPTMAGVLATLTAAARAGSQKLEVDSSRDFDVGDRIRITDRHSPQTSEEVTIRGFGSILLATPLINSYSAGSCITRTADDKELPAKLTGVATAVAAAVAAAAAKEGQVEEQARKKAEEQVTQEAASEYRRKEAADEQTRLQAEQEVRKEVEEQMKKEVEEKVRKEVEEQMKKEAEEQTRREVEEQARKEAEEQMRKEVEEEMRKEAEEQMRKEAEEQMRKEAEEEMRKEAEEQMRKEVAEEMRKEAEEHARNSATERARQEAAEQLRKTAQEHARLRVQEAAEQARKAAVETARKAAEEQAHQEAAEKARAEAEKKRRALLQRRTAAREAALHQLRAAAMATAAAERQAQEEREARERQAREERDLQRRVRELAVARRGRSAAAVQGAVRKWSAQRWAAVTAIQRTAMAWSARRRTFATAYERSLRRLLRAAMRIQAVWRGTVARCAAEELRATRAWAELHAAAAAVQRAWRAAGERARQAVLRQARDRQLCILGVAALTVQRWVRGMQSRVAYIATEHERYARRELRQRITHESAVLIQCAARWWLAWRRHTALRRQRVAAAVVVQALARAVRGRLACSIRRDQLAAEAKARRVYDAAVVIECQWRARVGRQEGQRHMTEERARRKKAAVAMLQAWSRARKARKVAAELRQQRLLLRAVVHIQSRVRAWKAAKFVRFWRSFEEHAKVEEEIATRRHHAAAAVQAGARRFLRRRRMEGMRMMAEEERERELLAVEEARRLRGLVVLQNKVRAVRAKKRAQLQKVRSRWERRASTNTFSPKLHAQQLHAKGDTVTPTLKKEWKEGKDGKGWAMRTAEAKEGSVGAENARERARAVVSALGENADWGARAREKQTVEEDEEDEEKGGELSEEEEEKEDDDGAEDFDEAKEDYGAEAKEDKHWHDHNSSKDGVDSDDSDEQRYTSRTSPFGQQRYTTPAARSKDSNSTPPATAGALATLTAAARAGSQKLEVDNSRDFDVGDRIRITDRHSPQTSEEVTIRGFGSILLATPLINSYSAGSCITRTADDKDDGGSGSTGSGEEGLVFAGGEWVRESPPPRGQSQSDGVDPFALIHSSTPLERGATLAAAARASPPAASPHSLPRTASTAAVLNDDGGMGEASQDGGGGGSEDTQASAEELAMQEQTQRLDMMSRLIAMEMAGDGDADMSGTVDLLRAKPTTPPPAAAASAAAVLSPVSASTSREGRPRGVRFEGSSEPEEVADGEEQAVSTAVKGDGEYNVLVIVPASVRSLGVKLVVCSLDRPEAPSGVAITEVTRPPSDGSHAALPAPMLAFERSLAQLLPGMPLLSVNGIDVRCMTKDDIVGRIVGLVGEERRLCFGGGESQILDMHALGDDGAAAAAHTAAVKALMSSPHHQQHSRESPEESPSASPPSARLAAPPPSASSPSSSSTPEASSATTTPAHGTPLSPPAAAPASLPGLDPLPGLTDSDVPADNADESSNLPMSVAHEDDPIWKDGPVLQQRAKGIVKKKVWKEVYLVLSTRCVCSDPCRVMASSLVLLSFFSRSSRSWTILFSFGC